MSNRSVDAIMSSLTHDEKMVLLSFYSCCEDVYRHSMIQQKELKVKSSIKYKDDSDEVDIEHYEPDEERFESLLIRIRKFCNQKDKIHFPKVMNVLIRNERCKEENNFLLKAKDTFIGKGVNLIKYGVSGKEYDEESLFELYINGKIFHSDHKKNEQISLVQDIFGLPIAHIMIRNASIYKVNAILAIYAYLKEEIIAE